jgi:hypothetical protein
MRVFRSNGLRFYPVDSALAPTGTRFLDLPYERQKIAHQINNFCPGNWAWYDDILRIQVESATVPTWAIRDNLGATLATGGFADTGPIIPGSDNIIWWATIDLAAIAGKTADLTVLLESANSSFLSEPINDIGRKGLKFTYANFSENYDHGAYRNCNEMIGYVRGQLIDYILPSDKVVYQDAKGRFRNLLHNWHDGRTLKTEWLTWFEIQILQAALHHDKLEISENTGTEIVTSQYEILRENSGNLSRPNESYQGYVFEIPLVEVGTFGRRLGNPVNPIGTFLIAFLPETNIVSGGVTINWQPVPGAEKYNVKISTSPDFSTGTQIFTDVLATSYSFSGLTPCTKYYYAVQAVSCDAVSPYSSNTNEHRQSVHFRGDFRAATLFFDEKIAGLVVNNIFANAIGVAYKIQPGNIPDPANSSWANFPALTLSQLQSNINLQPGTYTILAFCNSFANGTDAVLELVYTVPFFWVRFGCTTYNFGGGVSQDVFIGATKRMQIEGVSLSAGTVIGYELVTSAAQNVADFNLTVSQLNAQIALLQPSQPYLVAVYVSNPNTTATIDVTYL